MNSSAGHCTSPAPRTATRRPPAAGRSLLGGLLRRPPGRAEAATAIDSLRRDDVARPRRDVARVASLANAGEVLVSSTVRDLVSGSGPPVRRPWHPRAEGVGEWRIYAALPEA